MEEPITLEQIKADLRLDPTDIEQDGLLSRLIVAARRMVEMQTGRAFGGDLPTLTGEDRIVGAQAISSIVAHWYANPEAVSYYRSSDELPLSASWIIDSLRSWDDGA